ncbi:glutaminyl-peptide cyclotransferase [Candidatus Pacearchaeota archaeon]|nr:glutaminyl-peptide cyclotransferase [Candidatus Pacearchaeota archaeon]
MKRKCKVIEIIVLALLVCIITLSAQKISAGEQISDQAPPVYSYKIISKYNHDSNAFTQGLCFSDNLLYEGTGLYGNSRLTARTLDGRILASEKLPNHLFGEGITVLGEKIIQLTWKSGIGFVYDQHNLRVEKFFRFSTEGWGITHDGKFLIMSNGSHTLFFIDPSTYKLHRQIIVRDNNKPVTLLNELEYIENEVWANIWKDSRIARINPETGKVVGWIDLSPMVAQYAPPGGDNVLNGIAYDNEKKRIIVTGKRWPYLFEIQVIPPLPNLSHK